LNDLIAKLHHLKSEIENLVIPRQSTQGFAATEGFCRNCNPLCFLLNAMPRAFVSSRFK